MAARQSTAIPDEGEFLADNNTLIPWHDISSVFLDMDGTLLDLHFDNHFWREHVPLRYAERHSLEIEAAKERGVYQGRKPGATKAKPSQAKKLRKKGLTLDEIATAMGVSRMTVCRYLKA